MKKRKLYGGVVIPAHHLRYCKDELPSKWSEPVLSLEDGVSRFHGISAFFGGSHGTIQDEPTVDDLKIVSVQGQDGEQDV